MDEQSTPFTTPPTVPVVSSAAVLPSVSVFPTPALMTSAQPATTTGGSSSASLISTAAAPSTIAQTTMAPQRLNTQYGIVLWPPLPGMQQVAVGVAPPSPSMAGSGPPIGSVVEVTGGGGILASPGTAGMASPGVTGLYGSRGLSGSTAARGRQSELHPSSSPNNDDSKAPNVPPDRENMVVLRSACDACHRMKRKCDGLQPCNRCHRRSRPCRYSYKQKSGPPKGSKRKLIAAEEDLLENRQGRQKLLPIAMWPQDAERGSVSQGAGAVGSGITAEKRNGGGNGGAEEERNEKAVTSSGTNGINHLLAVGGCSQPKLPGISIPTEGDKSNGTRSSAGGSSGSVGSRLSSRGVARGGGTSGGGKKRGANPRPIADLVLPIGAAQLSLEVRAGAYKKAQEAAAAGMAAARAFVEGDRPTDKHGDFVADKRSNPTAISQSLLSPAVAAGTATSTSQKQDTVSHITTTPAPSVSSRSLLPTPAPASSAAAGPAVGAPSSCTRDTHENLSPSISVSSISVTAPTKSSSLGLPTTSHPPPAAFAAAAAAAAAATAAAQQVAAGGAQVAPVASASAAPPAPAGIPHQGAMSPGMPLPYHPQYGMYHPYHHSLYAAYLAQYQFHQGMSPYDGMYDPTNYYGNLTMYGPEVAAAAAAAAAASAADSSASTPASVAVLPPAASVQRQGRPLLPGVTGKTPLVSVTTRGAAVSSDRPKESEKAKQAAVETLLGLKNAQSSKGGETAEEASAQAMAAATAAAMSAAAAVAQEAAVNATAAGAEMPRRKAVAAAGGIASYEERPPTMGSRFDTPLVGDGNDITAEAAAAMVTAVEHGRKSGALRSVTSVAVVPPALGKRNVVELSCSGDVTSAEATSKRGRTVAPSV